jgi:hypothetical protein
LEHTPWDPDQAAVLADLDAERHRLPFRIPASVLGNVKNIAATTSIWLRCSLYVRGGIATRATGRTFTYTLGPPPI